MVVASFTHESFCLALFLLFYCEFYGSFEKCFSDLSSLFVKTKKNFSLPRGSVDVEKRYRFVISG